MDIDVSMFNVSLCVYAPVCFHKQKSTVGIK